MYTFLIPLLFTDQLILLFHHTLEKNRARGLISLDDIGAWISKTLKQFRVKLGYTQLLLKLV